METKTQTTPGPWSVGLDTDDERAQVITADGEHLCYVELSPELANARLIARAPDMLKALRGVLHHNDGLKEPYKISPALVRHIEQAIDGL